MAKMGRPKGEKNKEYNYTIRMDEETKNRLELYCKRLNIPKSDVIRFAINEMLTERKSEKE